MGFENSFGGFKITALQRKKLVSVKMCIRDRVKVEKLGRCQMQFVKAIVSDIRFTITFFN